MLKIADCPLTRFQNDEHFNFHTEVNGLVTNITAATLLISAEYAAYLPLLQQEEDALNFVRKSSYSLLISASDKVRDNTLAGMNDAIDSGLKHFDPAVRASSGRLKILLDTTGNIARKAYNKETGDILKLLADLKGTYAADVAAAKIGDWVSELEKNNNAFVELQNSRYDEAAEKTRLRMTDVRVDVDAAYKTMIAKINALIIVNGEAPYVDFVNKLNLRIAAYVNNLSIYSGKSKNPIPPATA
jgi:hypothetical protein